MRCLGDCFGTVDICLVNCWEMVWISLGYFWVDLCDMFGRFLVEFGKDLLGDVWAMFGDLLRDVWETWMCRDIVGICLGHVSEDLGDDFGKVSGRL